MVRVLIRRISWVMSHSSVNAASAVARHVDGTPTWRPSALISEISSAAAI